MPQILTRYITVDEFKEYFGIDLDASLNDTDNPSNKSVAFLKRVEDSMEVFLNAHFFKKITDLWPWWSDEQKYWYKMALLEQAYYIFKNGDITRDSGYDPERGIVASKHALTEISIAPNTKNYLRMTGLWSAHIGSGGFFIPWVA